MSPKPARRQNHLILPLVVPQDEASEPGKALQSFHSIQLLLTWILDRIAEFERNLTRLAGRYLDWIRNRDEPLTLVRGVWYDLAISLNQNRALPKYAVQSSTVLFVST